MSELSSAIRNICDEKGLSYDAVVSTIESALAAAYRKDYGQKNQNIKVDFDPETGKSKVFDVKIVVDDLPKEDEGETEEDEEKNKKTKKKDDKKGKKEAKKEKVEDEETEERKFNPRTDIQISDAVLIEKDAKIDDEIKTELEPPEEYGRMAAQTAKQVIIQRLREAEREMVFSEFKDKEGEVVSGVVQRKEGRFVLVDLGKSVGILPTEEQIVGENYNPGSRVKVYIKEVRFGSRGAEIVLSRTSEEILKKVFYLEIPEISNGLIEIKSVAREAGSRSKVAVWTDSENVDPIGSCVGQRGARIQTIITELGGEKVDIIQYDEDPKKYISNALSPAKINNIEINEETKKAVVNVMPDQLSLAIGKSGQNARLAAKLTGWTVDIVSNNKEESSKEETEKTEKKKEKKEKTKEEKKKEVKEKKEEKGTKKKVKEKEEKNKEKKKDNKKDKEKK